LAPAAVAVRVELLERLLQRERFHRLIAEDVAGEQPNPYSEQVAALKAGRPVVVRGWLLPRGTRSEPVPGQYQDFCEVDRAGVVTPMRREDLRVRGWEL
jgi:hypothetical protein